MGIRTIYNRSAQPGYNNAGDAYQSTDPERITNQTNRDDAGRTTTTIEAVGTTSARTTNFGWTLDNLPANMTAVNSSTGE
jgi:hypothetical protein